MSVGSGSDDVLPRIFAEGCRRADIGTADEAFWLSRLSAEKIRSDGARIPCGGMLVAVTTNCLPSNQTCIEIFCDHDKILDAMQFVSALCGEFRNQSVFSALLELSAMAFARYAD